MAFLGFGVMSMLWAAAGTRTDGSTPLSDDVEQIVTCANVRKRTNAKRKANGTRGHTSTDQYNHAKTKWFLNFCKFAGWDFEERLVFLDPVTKEVKKGTFRRFAAYLHARSTAGWKHQKASVIALVGWLSFLINYISTKKKLKLQPLLLNQI